MNLKLLVAGAGVVALAAGAAQAATHHASTAGGPYAAPSQPVAYSKLDAYLRASPSQRTRSDWALSPGSASAQTGAAANASATAPATPAPDATAAQPATPATPDMSQTPPTPPTPPAPPADSSTPQTPPTPQ